MPHKSKSQSASQPSDATPAESPVAAELRQLATSIVILDKQMRNAMDRLSLIEQRLIALFHISTPLPPPTTPYQPPEIPPLIPRYPRHFPWLPPPSNVRFTAHT